MSVQVTPSPVYPGGHVHVNEPAESVQYAASKQLCVPAVHSLICVHAVLLAV